MARGNARARAALRYDPSAYTPYALHDWTTGDLKREYTRLRNIAVKRIKRLRADPEGRASRALDIFDGGLPERIGEMHGSRTRLEMAMANLALFVRSAESTVGGVREANRARARIAGAEDADNMDAPAYMGINEWMEYARASGLMDAYGSEEARDYYYDAGGVHVSAEDMAVWYGNYKEWAESRQREHTPESGSDSESFWQFTNSDFL